MSHIPVNHRLQPLYRFLAALAGLYVLIFGIVAFTKTHGSSFFGQDQLSWALGLRANPAFAVISIVAGAIILACAVIGRNIDRAVNLVTGILFMAAGVLMLLLIRTNANFLGFSMANCIVSLIIGTVLFSAAMYGKTGPSSEAATEERVRHAV